MAYMLPIFNKLAVALIIASVLFVIFYIRRNKACIDKLSNTNEPREASVENQLRHKLKINELRANRKLYKSRIANWLLFGVLMGILLSLSISHNESKFSHIEALVTLEEIPTEEIPTKREYFDTPRSPMDEDQMLVNIYGKYRNEAEEIARKQREEEERVRSSEKRRNDDN